MVAVWCSVVQCGGSVVQCGRSVVQCGRSVVQCGPVWSQCGAVWSSVVFRITHIYHVVRSVWSTLTLSFSGHSMSDCGRKSRCIQRYNFQHLLAVDPDNLHSCPTIRAFKFPSSCVCHIDYPNHHEDFY